VSSPVLADARLGDTHLARIDSAACSFDDDRGGD
jgi:hypothetical protein